MFLDLECGLPQIIPVRLFIMHFPAVAQIMAFFEKKISLNLTTNTFAATSLSNSHLENTICLASEFTSSSHFLKVRYPMSLY